MNVGTENPAAEEFNAARQQITEDRAIIAQIFGIRSELRARAQTRQRSIALTKLQEAEMWLADDAEVVKANNPGAAPREMK